ncbi:MAG: phosphoribosylformylglycinamidine synthase subunit PurS [Nitrososphaerales archaeon]
MAVLNRYMVNVVIENKPLIRDPEGETILRDLMIKNGATYVKKVKTAKLLKLEVEAEDKEHAKKITESMCNDLRIFNSVVSLCKITVTSGNK